MVEAHIVNAVRIAVGKRGGGLATVHPADMAAHVISPVTMWEVGGRANVTIIERT